MNLIIAIVIVVLIVWYKFGNTILKLIQILRHKSFTANPDQSMPLTSEQQKLISAGLIIAEQNMFYCDTLLTGGNKKQQKDQLNNSWGISSQQSALMRLAEFGSIHKLYDAAIDVYLTVEKAQYQPYIENNFPEQIQLEILDYLQQLDAISPLLIKKQLAINEDEVTAILRRGSIAWDLGRIVYLARSCLTVGYFNTEQAWQIISSIQIEFEKNFTDWKSYGQSYMLGRSLWSYEDAAIDGLFDIYLQAVSSANSPWLKYPL